MGRVYLIRHGHPDFPIGSRICLGQTDTPLGPLGHLQGVLLARAFANTPLDAVYTSPLTRAVETARYLCAAPIVVKDLAERATGLWDGLSFDEIKRRWPDDYARRGSDPTLTMPGGEDLAQAQVRFAAAMEEILHTAQGDIAIVAHKGVIEAFLQPLCEQPLARLPYGGFWALTQKNGALIIEANAPTRPRPTLDRALCLALLREVAPDPVIRHCEAVEALALEISDQLPLPLDQKLISQAALLHDIARVEKDHAHLGAKWLAQLGYEDVAAIVRQHHDLETTAINEASIVYLADKGVQGEARVSIAARFAAAKAKCQSAEALAAWEQRWQMTTILAQSINTCCRKEIISS